MRKATSINGDYEYAVKIISKSDPENYDTDNMMRELRILEVVNHPNIPKIYGVYEDVDRMYIFMENVESGSLFDRLKQKFYLEQDEAADVIYDILETMNYLQELKIMHRDIKPENILVHRNDDGKITKSFLIDFGLSTFYDHQTKKPEKQMCGTLGYVAPEVFNEKGYNYQVDMFSLGVVLFFLVTGELPFDSKSDSKIVDFTLKNDIPIKSSVFANLHPKLPELLKSMVEKNPKNRMSIKDCLNHEFFKEFSSRVNKS